MKALLGVVGFLVMLYGLSQVGFAQEKSWLVRSKNASSMVQFTLLEDGSIQRVNRGDPKTTYDQSENRFHSEKQRAKKQTTQPTFDLTTWIISAQGGSNYTTDFRVNFQKPRTSGDQLFEVILVYYDLKAGGVPTKAIYYSISPVDGSETPSESVPLEQINVTNYYDLPLPSCTTVECSGFDENGNITKVVTVTYDGQILR